MELWARSPAWGKLSRPVISNLSMQMLLLFSDTIACEMFAAPVISSLHALNVILQPQIKSDFSSESTCSWVKCSVPPAVTGEANDADQHLSWFTVFRLHTGSVFAQQPATDTRWFAVCFRIRDFRELNLTDGLLVCLTLGRFMDLNTLRGFSSAEEGKRILFLTLMLRLHHKNTQIFPCSLASHSHENPVFITENDSF